MSDTEPTQCLSHSLSHSRCCAEIGHQILTNQSTYIDDGDTNVVCSDVDAGTAHHCVGHLKSGIFVSEEYPRRVFLKPTRSVGYHRCCHPRADDGDH